MNKKLFTQELWDKEPKLKDMSIHASLAGYEDENIFKRGLPANVCKELGELKYDLIYEDEDLDEVAVILYTDKPSYDLRRGSTVKFIIKKGERTIIFRVARGVSIPMFEEWYTTNYKQGAIPMFAR